MRILSLCLIVLTSLAMSCSASDDDKKHSSHKKRTKGIHFGPAVDDEEVEHTESEDDAARSRKAPK